MPINGMSVGKDYTLAYYDTNSGQIVELGDVQNVKITANKHDIKNQPYNKPPKHGYIPDGYSFTFTAVRTGPTLEDFQLAANTRFNEGNEELAGLLNENIVEPGGTVSKYQYTGFVFWITDIGDISRDKSVMLQMVGAASDKIRLT